MEELKSLANPAHVMRARLALEPELAGLAAANATAHDIAEIKRFCELCECSKTWAEYELCDYRLHQAIAGAAHNPVLIALVDLLSSLRTTVNNGRKRLEGGPTADHHSFAEHRLLVEAISSQNPRLAADCMRNHLMTVEDRLLGRR
jgi:DNA-binding FadR family transcriptional regulator